MKNSILLETTDVLSVQGCFAKRKTRLQLLYTDVQQLKMVQMVSQSQFFRDHYLLYLMRLPICRKNVRNFKQNFARKVGNCSKYF